MVERGAGLTFAIPDLHGRCELLDAALAMIERRASAGTIVFLGDYVDRGPHSRRVVQRLVDGAPADWRWVCLQGNHESMMLDAMCRHRPITWLQNGGGQTLLSYGHPREGRLDYGIVPADHLAWLEALPLFYEDPHRIFVHAGVDSTLELCAQSQKVLQNKVYDDEDSRGFGRRHVVHGHRAAASIVRGDRTALDIYARSPERLIVGVFDGRQSGGPVDLLEVTG